jgi:hypothetical protein
MFIGHYAVALASKKAAPDTSLGTLFLSAQLADLLWPIFLLLGIKHLRIDPGNTAVTPLDFYDYPFSHSLVGSIVLSFASGLLYYGVRRYARGAWMVGLCVFSHWTLDAVVHRPDLPLLPGGNIYIGIGLWNSLIGTIVVELGIFLIALGLYLRTTSAQDRLGRYGLWSLVIFLVIIWLANFLGPPPPNERAIAIAGNAAWLFILWAYWIDRHRSFVHRREAAS